MPNVGNKSGMPGGSVPLFGEAEIQAQTTGVNILTLTAPSTMDANYLVLRGNVAVGSTSTASDKFVVSSAGVITKGGFGNSTTSSGGATIGSSMSGTIYQLTGTTAAAAITLPTPHAGAYYGFVIDQKPTTGAYSFTCGTTGSFIVAGDSGCDGVAWSTVMSLPGAMIEFIGLSATKYAVRAAWPGTTEVQNTGALATDMIAASS